MDLWGLSSTVGAGGNSSARNHEPDRAENAEKSAKRQKTQKTQNNQVLAKGGGGASGAGDAADTSSQSGAVSLSSSSWMFSARLSNKAVKTKGSEHAKDFDQTERAIGQADALKPTISNPDTFLSVTYQKARNVMDKIVARNTEALQTMYRERSQNGDTRGLDLLRRVTSCEKEVQCILNYVSALHDPESTAETLSQTTLEARSEGVPIPNCSDRICKARLVKQLAKCKDWARFFEAIDMSKGLDGIFDSSEDDAVLDFQSSSLISTLEGLLMHEVKIGDAEKVQGGEGKEEEKKRLEEMETMKNKHALEVERFLDAFSQSAIYKFMNDKASGSPIFLAMNKLHGMFSLMAKGKEGKLEDKDVEDLKNHRSHFVSSKKAMFDEAMTLFPVGSYISTCASEMCSAFHRDKGFSTDLDELLVLVDGFKAFTTDVLRRSLLLQRTRLSMTSKSPLLPRLLR